MRLNTVLDAKTLDDSQLVELGLNGNRDAFSELVSRYQSPICALAYSACGNIPSSEDLAQETFIIAWRKLGDLKEPAKFKSWLYGIARNLINNTFRQQIRNPLAAAERWDESLTVTSTVSSPAEQVISKEEEGILWRSLEHIPGVYREPLILFYREHQSIKRVAAILDLSEEAVRQRLSRGRKLLHERVIAFVEGALERTAPNQAFTFNVMLALPHLTNAAGASAVGGAALKGSATGKAAASASLFTTMLGPFIGFFGAVAGTWAMASYLPESSRERRFARKAWTFWWVLTVLYVLGIYIVTHEAGWNARPQVLVAVLLGSSFGYGLVAMAFWLRAGRTQTRIQKEEIEHSVNPRFISRAQPYEYRSPQTIFGLPLLHIRFNCVKAGKTLPAKGWIAVGDRAYGIVFAFGKIAVASVSMGFISIGLLAIGGVGIGLLGFGAIGLGVAATGGGAVGYVAYGGAAVGWLGAAGGAAFAHNLPWEGPPLPNTRMTTPLKPSCAAALFFVMPNVSHGP